jgi:aminoglycoside phosphotransferase (APT) family kinase protein
VRNAVAPPRDRDLPARLGDPELVPPGEDEVLALVRAHLLADPADPPVGASWERARWKPGVAVAACFRLAHTSGAESLVAVKRWAGDKARAVASGRAADARAAEASGPLLPRALADDGRTLLFAPAGDPKLPGVGRALDVRRTGRLLEEFARFPGLALRRRRTRFELLRYKPERRAVLRLDLALRDAAEELVERRIAARVLPPEAARRVAGNRGELEALGSAIGPTLLGGDLRAGILFEPWLEGEPAGPERWDLAAEVGAAAAALHRFAADGRPPAAPAASGARALLSRSALLSELLPDPRELVAPEAREARWVHGDLHSDQLLLRAGEPPALLDLDEVRPGDPARDLSDFVADHLAADPSVELEEAAAPLLAAHASAGGPAIDRSDFARHVARALVARAAARLRRLEAGALDMKPSPLQRALDALAASEGPLAVTAVTRVEAGRDAGIVLELDGPRWLRFEGEELRELHPGQDERVRLAAARAERAWEDGELLSWRPGRRVVLDDGPEAVLKGWRKKRAAGAVRRHALLAELAGGDGFLTPQVLESLPELEAVRLSRLPGSRPRVAAADARAFLRSGAALRRLQEAAAPDELPLHDAAAEIGVLADLSARHAVVAGDPPGRWPAVFEDLVQRTSHLPENGAVACHRDLHDGQLLAGTGRIGLLDADLLCRADAALDPANLLAHMALRERQHFTGADEEGVESCGRAMLEGLDRGGEAECWPRLRFYQASSFLRLALVYDLRPRWRHLTPTLVELAARCLSLRHGG